MADYVSGEVTKQLAKDRYNREDALEIGSFNGVPLNVNYSFSDNKFYLSVPSIGYSREVSHSGFIPDFSTMAMTAFKTHVLNDTAEDIEAVHAQQIKDTEKRIKRLRDDAKRFTEEYNKDKEKLIALRKERERLERAVTPLIVQTTEDHKYSVYGNWYISKIQGGYRAVRGSDREELVATTVKALIPMMDDADFSKPGSGANKTVELRQKLEKRGVDASVESVKPKDVDFDDKAFEDELYNIKLSEAEKIDKRDGTNLVEIMSLSKLLQDDKDVSHIQHRHYKFSLNDSDILRDKGISGEYFTVHSGIMKRHFGKNKDHQVTPLIWFDLSSSVKKPIVIEEYPDGDDKYRLWTNTQINSKPAVVGITVKHANKELVVNSVATVFGANVVPNEKRIIYKNNEELQALLSRHNRDIYPATPVDGSSVAQSGGDVNGSIDFDDKAFAENEEYRSVEAKYRNTPMWMKAPNGKPTNLTERQWVQVRTPSFKAWFGDWETRSIVDFLEGNVFAEVSGDEFSNVTSKDLARAVFDSFAEEQRTIENLVIGKIRLTKGGIRDSIFHGIGRRKVAAFKVLPEILANGRVVKFTENWKVRGYNSYIIATPISVSGDHCIAFAIVNNTKDGSTFYLHEVGVLDDVKKEAVAIRTGSSDETSALSRNHGDIKSVALSLFAVNPNSVSKVVDENGEPRVMYHGDRENVGGYSIFDMRYARSNDVTQSRGFYFTNSKAYAEGFGGDVREFFLNIRNPYEGKRSDANIDNGEFDYYSANLDRIERANEYVLENISSAINEMEEFIRDGIDGDESLEDALDESANYQYLIGLKEGLWFLDQSNYTDFVNDILSQYDLGKFGKDIIDILGLNEEDEAHVFTAWLRGNYYDGQIDDQISGYEKGIEQIIVLDPNQIKSATHNNGDFSRSNDAIDFDDTALRPDPTPEEVDKLVGITNEDIDLRTRALGLKPSPHETVGFDHMHRQAEILLSNPEYMKKLIRAVYKWDNGGRGVAPHENLAIGQFFTALSNEIEADKAYLDEIKGMIESGDITDEETINEYKRKRAKFDKKLALHAMTEVAKKKGVGNAARTLLSNRDMLRPDLTFAGIVSKLSEAYGLSVENGIQLPPEVMKAAEELAEKFKELSADEVAFYARRVREYSKKVFADHAKKVKARAASANSNEAAIVTRNYLDAMTQIEVAANNGDVDLLGLQDNTIPGFGKWLKAIAEYHIMTNPDIMADPETAEEKVVAAIVEDVQTFLPEVTADAVRRAYTGYGHHFKQSNRETQAIMNDLRGQSLSKLQLKTMRDENRLPPVTGMERDEPSDVRRRLMKDVYEAKKMTPEGAANSLKGVLQSAKKAIDNRIKDLQHAIETGVALPKREHRVFDDIEIIKKRAELEELKKKYDEIFKTTRVLTDEERVKMAEKALGRALEKLTNEVIAARQGMFKNEQRRTLTSSTLEVLRQKANEMRKELLDLKKAAYYHGKTPAEIMALNRRRIENLRKLTEKKANWVRDGKRPAKADPLPMTPNQKKEYERLAKANKEASDKLRQMEEDARRRTWVAPARAIVDTWNLYAGVSMVVNATVDASAVFRQALKLTFGSVFRNPKNIVKSFSSASRASFNREYFEMVNEAIMNDPIIREAVDKFGLKIRSSDIANVHDVEQFAMRKTLIPRWVKRTGDLLGYIPGVGYVGKKSLNLTKDIIEKCERHYITYINMMAATEYKLACDAMPGGITDFQKRKIADDVNVWSGSGALSNKMRANINYANTWGGKTQPIIWSTGLMTSQIQQAVLYDVWGAFAGHSQDAKDGMKERFAVAKYALKYWVRAELARLLFGFLLEFLWSDDDEWEEFKNASFVEKLYRCHFPIIGKTHIDLMMGERSFLKMLRQLLTASYETATGRKVQAGDFGYRDIYSTVGRYLGGKLSPAYGRLIALVQGRDFVGKPYGVKEALLSHLPLSLGDIYDSAVQNEWANGQAEVAIALTLLGAGGNVYEERYYERAVNPVKELMREYNAVAEDATIDNKERRERMASMVSKNPILSPVSQIVVKDRLKRISKDRQKALDNEIRDGKPDEALLEKIEKNKRELMEFIRKVN